MPSLVYCNGRFVPKKDAKISIFDRSYLYGEGCFETMRSYSGRVAFQELHYHRLRENCLQLDLDLPLDLYAFTRMLHQLIQRNKTPDAYIRATVSGVGASFGITRPNKMPIQVIAFCKAFEGKPQQWYAQGAKVIVAQSVVGDQPKLANLKSTNYLSKLFARREAESARTADALLTDGRGRFLEGSATNLFVVSKGQLITPPLRDGILPGITRSAILGVADTLDIPWRECSLTEKILCAADEIFLCGSTSEVLPVREIVDVCKKKAPGPVTKILMTAYGNLVRKS